MSNERTVHFQTSVRLAVACTGGWLRELIGFIPTEEQCESLSLKELRTTEVKMDENRYIDDITYYLRQINADYPEIIFDEPLLVYLGVEYYDENDFAMVFEFSVCGICYVTDGENLTDNEVRKIVDDLVFEKCECKL